MDDPSRLKATDSDNVFALTIEDVANCYDLAGHPRTIRTLQRYCKSGHLDALKKPTLLGDMYLVTQHSVDRHIAQTIEMHSARFAPTGRALPRPVATGDAAERNDKPSSGLTTAGNDPARLVAANVVSENMRGLIREPTQARGDESRQAAAGALEMSRLVAFIENENEFLRGQVIVKDTQIKDLTERARETNHLIAGLQRMLSPLLGTRRDDSASHRDDQSDFTIPLEH